MNIEKISIAVSVTSIVIAIVAIIVVIVVSTKKSSTSSSSSSAGSYTFPDPNQLFILENEGITGGFSAVYLAQADPILFDAQWCGQTLQLLRFEYVRDGAIADTKIYRIKQANDSSTTTPYLAYDSTANDLISQSNISASNKILWEVKSLPNVQSIHNELLNGTTLGVYSIKNVLSGLGLSFTAVASSSSSTNYVSMATYDETAKNQQWTITQVACS